MGNMVELKQGYEQGIAHPGCWSTGNRVELKQYWGPHDYVDGVTR